MIIRAGLFFLAFVVAFFAFYWTVFRTKFFSGARNIEITKVGLLAVIATVSAVGVIAFIITADKLS
jgi:hypothetical protein